MDKINL